MDRIVAAFLRVKNILGQESGEGSGCLGLAAVILCFAVVGLLLIGGGSSGDFMDLWEATSFK